jgi:hypothetical protein
MYMSEFTEKERGEAGAPECAATLPKPFANHELLHKVYEVLAMHGAAASSLS